MSDTDPRTRRSAATPAPPGRDRANPGVFNQSLERGLLVMRALSVPGQGRTLSEVAREIALPRAAVRRFLFTLEELGYVRSEARRYWLTPRVLELGYAYLSNLSLPEITQPHLRELVSRVDESSSVAILDGTEIVYVAREPTRRIMTVTIAIGTRFPAHATSMGRAILAELADEQVRVLFSAEPLARATDRTVTDVERLIAELGHVRRHGWALVDQELENGLRSIARPLRDRAGHTVAAVNISAHASRTTIKTLQGPLLAELSATAAAIERDLAASSA